MVVLLASAGGVAALSTVLQQIPANLSAAVIVQLHLGGQSSGLVSVFRRRTSAHVDWADACGRLQPGQVPVCPPQRRLELYPDGVYDLLEVQDARSLPHDALLRSVADSYGPHILLTARAGDDAATEGLLAGAHDYIVKPFSARELLARVGAQIELARMRRSGEQRFHALMEASFDAVYRMSPDWSQMYALDGRGFIVDTATPTTGWLQTYIHPDDQPAVLAAIDDAIRHRKVFQFEHRVRQTDGSLGWTLSRAVPLLDDEDNITEWVGTATDITQSRRNADTAAAERA